MPLASRLLEQLSLSVECTLTSSSFVHLWQLSLTVERTLTSLRLPSSTVASGRHPDVAHRQKGRQHERSQQAHNLAKAPVIARVYTFALYFGRVSSFRACVIAKIHAFAFKCRGGSLFRALHTFTPSHLHTFTPSHLHKKRKGNKKTLSMARVTKFLKNRYACPE